MSREWHTSCSRRDRSLPSVSDIKCSLLGATRVASDSRELPDGTLQFDELVPLA